MHKVYALCILFLGCASGGTSDATKANSHLQMGTSFLVAGNYPAALKELLQAESLDASNPMVQNNLSLAYMVRERFDLAEKHSRRAIELKPDFTEARNNLGRILIEQRLYDLAIQELTVANRDLTYSAPEQTLSNLGLAQLRKGRFFRRGRES